MINNEYVKKAEEELEYLNSDEEEKELARLREKAIRDEAAAMAGAIRRGREEGKAEGLAEGKAEGKAEGLEEGRAEEKAEIAKKMLEENIEIETISKLTGLTKEKIENSRRISLFCGNYLVVVCRSNADEREFRNFNDSGTGVSIKHKDRLFKLRSSRICNSGGRIRSALHSIAEIQACVFKFVRDLPYLWRSARFMATFALLRSCGNAAGEHGFVAQNSNVCCGRNAYRIFDCAFLQDVFVSAGVRFFRQSSFE